MKMKPGRTRLLADNTFKSVLLALILILPLSAGEQNVPATDVANAIDDLKNATLYKIDAEVEINARAFADAENIHNSLVWSDWFRPFLDIALAVYSGLTTIPSLETGSARGYLHTAIQAADAGKSYFSIYASFDRFRQDGANLALAIDGPSYNSVVAAMLDRADSTSFFFNYALYNLDPA